MLKKLCSTNREGTYEWFYLVSGFESFKAWILIAKFSFLVTLWTWNLEYKKISTQVEE